MVRRYCVGTTVHTNIYGNPNDVTDAFYGEFSGGLTVSNVPADDNSSTTDTYTGRQLKRILQFSFL